MASQSKHAARPVRAEVENKVRDQLDDRRSPRAGKTGGLGRRAERPAPGTLPTNAPEDTSARTPEPARGSKSPSAGSRARAPR